MPCCVPTICLSLICLFLFFLMLMFFFLLLPQFLDHLLSASKLYLHPRHPRCCSFCSLLYLMQRSIHLPIPVSSFSFFFVSGFICLFTLYLPRDADPGSIFLYLFSLLFVNVCYVTLFLLCMCMCIASHRQHMRSS